MAETKKSLSRLYDDIGKENIRGRRRKATERAQVPPLSERDTNIEEASLSKSNRKEKSKKKPKEESDQSDSEDESDQSEDLSGPEDSLEDEWNGRVVKRTKQIVQKKKPQPPKQPSRSQPSRGARKAIIEDSSSDESSDSSEEDEEDNSSDDEKDSNGEVESQSNDSESEEGSEEEEERSLIETIIAQRKRENELELEYLVKVKGKAFLHIEWMTAEEIEEQFTNAKHRMSKFRQNPIDFIDMANAFNQDYLQVDRIIDQEGKGRQSKYLVKWKALTYEDATWESHETLQSIDALSAVKAYRQRNSQEAQEAAQEALPRPKSADIEPSTIPLPTFRGSNSLKDYQEEGFRWIAHCWHTRRCSILADEMGLGKTIQSVSMLQYLSQEFQTQGPFLIVAPMSTIEQWKREVETWTDLNAVIFHGSAEARELIYETEFFFDGVPKKARIFKFQVLITTFEVVMIELKRLLGVPWQYLIVDEGHRIKNRESKLFGALAKLRVRHKLLLTGTPLQNGIKELWTLLNFLEPKRFGNVDSFMRDFGDLKKSSQVDQLHKRLGPFMLRRMKDDVELAIPQKEETLVEIELTNIQKTYYKAVLERNREFLSKNGSKSSLMNLMMELRKCCNHPYLIKGAEDNILSDLADPSEDEVCEKLVQCSSKFVFVDKLLTRLRKEKRRVLIFSQMVKLLDLLEDYLTMKGHTFERLDGTMSRKDRQISIDRFSNNSIDSFVFLASTRAGGLGLNLTIADTVVLFDSDWNPQNDLQAQARCHRIGQTNSVKVYRLITRNTYEKKMFEVASKKLGLDKVVLGKRGEDGEGIVSGLDKDEIERILKHGVYELFQDQEEEEMDLDQILARSATVSYDPSKKESSSSLFSKATFSAVDEEAVEMTDDHFWDKVLPSFKSAKRLLTLLADETSLGTPKAIDKFISDVESLTREAQLRVKHSSVFADSSLGSKDLATLLQTAGSRKEFSEDHRKQFREWMASVAQPRLRKRSAPVKDSIPSPAPNPKKRKSEKEKKKEREREEKEKKRMEKEKKKREKDEKKDETEYSKAARDRVMKAMTYFGFGRWDQMISSFKKPNISLAEVEIFGECLLYQTFISFSEDDTRNILDLILKDCKQKTLEQLLELHKTHGSPRAVDDKIKLSLAGKKFGVGENLSLQISGNPTGQFLVASLDHEATPSCYLRIWKVTGSSQEVTLPGFPGVYTLRTVTVTSSGTVRETGTTHCFRVVPLPILGEEYEKSITAAQKKLWNSRLTLLRGLIACRANSNGDFRPPPIRTKAPTAWWERKDDWRLLEGVYRWGYGKYSDVQKDEELEWDDLTLERRMKELNLPVETKKKGTKDEEKKEDKGSLLPSAAVLNRRMLQLVTEWLAVIRRSAQSQNRPSPISPEPPKRSKKISMPDLLENKKEPKEETKEVKEKDKPKKREREETSVLSKYKRKKSEPIKQQTLLQMSQWSPRKEEMSSGSSDSDIVDGKERQEVIELDD